MQKLADGLKWVPVYNDSGERVPAFALMAVAGVEATGELTIEKPSADGQAGILINGPTDIPVDEFGQGTYDEPWFALYDTADGTPAAGETWGAGAGSWKARKDNAGFLVFGHDGFERAIVVRQGGSSSCDRINKVVTGVVTSGGVTTQQFSYICWPSGEVVFSGCEVLDELDCEPPPPPPPGVLLCCQGTIGDLTATLTNSSCAFILDPTTFTMTKKSSGTNPYWEGGYKYAETQASPFGGGTDHFCCTIEAFALCNNEYSNASGTDAYLILRYWKVHNDSTDALTYEDLIALEEANDPDTQVCTIGVYSPLQKDCFTGTGQSRSATGLVFTLYDTFADCEVLLGGSPCCETNGMTIDLELES